MSNSGEKALEYIKGVRSILNEIRTKEYQNIAKASEIISSSLADGHKAYYISEGHITPLATGYGFSGDAGVFLPLEMSELFSFGPYRNRMDGDVLLVSVQFDSSDNVNQIVSQAKLLDAQIIFIGAPSDRKIIPTALPVKTLAEMSDVCIDAHTPVGDALLSYAGLEARVAPTSGITSIAIFYALSLETVERLLSIGSLPQSNEIRETQTKS
jgi:uncharacterized phosphosugar-binding protein